MSQVIHILKKDIRYLRLEIGLFMATTAIYILTETYWRNRLGGRALLTVSAIYLIARLIHAETLPGDNQFWISRPYCCDFADFVSPGRRALNRRWANLAM